jgi:hypothetical protein
MHSGNSRRSRRAILSLLVGLVALVAPAAAHAQDPRIRLALLPIDQPGSYFDLTMRPGQTRSIEVEISNPGDAAIDARTYAADVYTIINGGFGARLRGEPQTGMTRWLDYATEVVGLRSGERDREAFTVAVPADAEPGEYITSIVLENDKPIPGSGSVTVDQIVRQAVAVVVTVPGKRAPALAIGEATHKVVAGRSVVSVAVENRGNVRLKPLIDVVLLDRAGNKVSEARIQMDTFYAHTDSFVEVALDALLVPGDYTVRVTTPGTEGLEAGTRDISLVVEAPPETTVAPGTVPGLTGVLQTLGDGELSIPLWSVVLYGMLVLGVIGAGVLMLVLRRRRRTPR